MKDYELYEFLEEVSGVKLYQEKKEEAFSNLALANQEKEEIVNALKELGKLIKQLDEEKETFKQLTDIHKEI